MAELATIARPYAEALFQVASKADLTQSSEPIDALAIVAIDMQVRRFAANPKVAREHVFDVICSALASPLSDSSKNLLHALIDNRRLSALPEIAKQFRALVNTRSGVSDAKIHSAFPIDATQLGELVGALEQRFGRKLNATVELEPELIGGVRVVVGDEVLDTSVRSRLAQMQTALTA